MRARISILTTGARRFGQMAADTRRADSKSKLAALLSARGTTIAQPFAINGECTWLLVPPAPHVRGQAVRTRTTNSRGGTRTPTLLSEPRILSPMRLPIPPLGHVVVCSFVSQFLPLKSPEWRMITTARQLRHCPHPPFPATKRPLVVVSTSGLRMPGSDQPDGTALRS